MSTNFRVRSVALLCTDHEYNFDFSAPATFLSGPIGTGKSSLLELLKYGLGGNAILTSAVKSSVREVVVEAQVGPSLALSLRRSLGSASGTVTVEGMGVRGLVYPVRPRVGMTTISDFLLESLGLPNVRVPKTRSRQSPETAPITFNDVFAYLYVEQAEIDRSIVHHLESFREQKRRTVFELMFGLSDPRAMQLQVEINQLKDQIRSQTERRQMLEAFLSETNVPSVEDLVQRVVALRRELAHSESALADLSASVRSSSRELDRLRATLRESEARYSEAASVLEAARRELAMREVELAQVELNQEREGRTRAAVGTLGSLAFVTCPQCLQELERARERDNHCSLCLQTLPLSGDVAAEYEGEDLLGLEEDLERLVEIARASMRRATRVEEVAREVRDRVREQLDALSAPDVAPLFSEIEALASSKATALAGIREGEHFLHIRQEVEGIDGQLDELSKKKAEADFELSNRTSPRAKSEIVTEMSDTFDELISFLKVPWYERGRIDARDYLPRLDEDVRMENVSVAGGTKTLISIAYHLTLLTHALVEPQSLLPALLIIDTPGKNLGSNADDRERLDLLYRRVRALIDAHQGRTQFILAVNDLPALRSGERAHRFDYDKPLIPHLAHPGIEAVTRGEVVTIGSRLP